MNTEIPQVISYCKARRGSSAKSSAALAISLVVVLTISGWWWWHLSVTSCSGGGGGYGDGARQSGAFAISAAHRPLATDRSTVGVCNILRYPWLRALPAGQPPASCPNFSSPLPNTGHTTQHSAYVQRSAFYYRLTMNDESALSFCYISPHGHCLSHSLSLFNSLPPCFMAIVTIVPSPTSENGGPGDDYYYRLCLYPFLSATPFSRELIFPNSRLCIKEKTKERKVYCLSKK